MRYRLSYVVSRGNALENEDYITDEMQFLRHQSIDTGDRHHDRDNNRGWMIVPSVEQVMWLRNHYAKIERCMHFTTLAVVVGPEDLTNEFDGLPDELDSPEKRANVDNVDGRGKVFVRFLEGNAKLANDIAALLIYTTGIQCHLLASSSGNDWDEAVKPDESSLVSRRTANESNKIMVGTADYPVLVGPRGLRGLCS
jgi:hypothetical protein